jgi:hypothetical protein
MLSQLDNIIFPDRCEVLEVAPQRFVYPIYKNGSSSLTKAGYQHVPFEKLPEINVIEIYVRDPYDRFLSGVQTYLMQNFALDRKTMLHIVGENLFLNRHYAPQFHWLVNLQRFTKAKIKINPIEKLSELTAHYDNQQDKDYDISEYFKGNEKIQFYTSIDKILTETLLGHTVRFKDIVRLLELKQPEVYNEIVLRSINLCSVLE